MRSWPDLILSEFLWSNQFYPLIGTLYLEKGGKGEVETGANTKLRGWNVSQGCSSTSFCLLMAVPERPNILKAPKVISSTAKRFIRFPLDSPFGFPFSHPLDPSSFVSILIKMKLWQFGKEEVWEKKNFSKVSYRSRFTMIIFMQIISVFSAMTLR